MNSENVFIRQLKKHPLSFLYRLIKNIVFSLFLFCLVLVVLYIAGNYQNFQAESQQFILSTLSFSSIVLLVLSILIMAETVVRLITKDDRLKSVSVILTMIFNIAFSIVCMSFSNIVYYISEGF